MTQRDDENVVRLLRDKKLRITAPRLAIMTALLSAGRPLTQIEISAALGPTAPDKTTVYRTLMTLLKAGLVHKAFVQQRQWHFEPAHQCTATQCHPHFTCVKCHRTKCLHGVSAPLVKLPDGLTLYRQQIRLEGICQTCCDG